MKKNLGFLCCLLVSFVNAQEILSSKQMLEDFDILREVAVELSPVMNCRDKEVLVNKTNKNREYLEGKSLTILEFAKQLFKINTDKSQYDNHARINLSNELIANIIGESDCLLPFSGRVIDSLSLYCTFKGAEIPFGAKIEKINKKSISEVLTKIYIELNVDSKSIESSLPLFYYMTYGKQKEILISYREFGKKKIKKKKISAISFEKMKELNMKQLDNLSEEGFVYDKDKMYRTKFYEDKKAYYLEVSHFFGDEKAIYAQYDSIFKEIKDKKAERLILDLRNNTGGNILVPGGLYMYITQQNILEQIKATIPNVEIPYHQYIYGIDSEHITPKVALAKVKDIKSSFLKLNNIFYQDEFIRFLEEQPNTFKGDVYLLVGPSTFSSAAYFTAIFKAFNRGKIIGQTLGGNYRNLTAGNMLHYKMPNSGITFTMPLMNISFFRAIYDNIKTEYINPDILISEKDILNGFLKRKDVVLDKTLQQIK